MLWLISFSDCWDYTAFRRIANQQEIHCARFPNDVTRTEILLYWSRLIQKLMSVMNQEKKLGKL